LRYGNDHLRRFGEKRRVQMRTHQGLLLSGGGTMTKFEIAAYGVLAAVGAIAIFAGAVVWKVLF
jgi:hypothetical protein